MVRRALISLPLRVSPLLLASAGLLACSGCASEGALRPPSLHLPANVQRFSAERFGNEVELRWVTPTRTTDGLALTAAHRSRGPFAAEICQSAAALAPGPCAPLAVISVEPGKPGAFNAVLTPPWSEGVPRAIYYRVRIVNVSGRGAEGTDIVVAGGAPVPALARLRATPAPGGGVALRWMPMEAGADDRITLRVVRGDAASPQILAVEPTPHDPGGADDAAARPGVQQRYTAFRTRIVALGESHLTIHSAPASVSVGPNTLPPPPPAPIGLDAVVNTLGTPEIDLVWQAADDRGVAGYVVYRSEAGAEFRPITPQLIHAFSFADTAVRSGVQYRYRVAAVDNNGTESSANPEIERALPAQ